MIKVYSNDITVSENASIPFNSVSLLKGCSTTLQGSSTIQLNKCGIYEVTVAASAAGTGDLSIQLRKNGVLQPDAISIATSAGDTDIVTLGFTTLVQATENNTCCPCSVPTNFEIVNVGPDATFSHVETTVVRI